MDPVTFFVTLGISLATSYVNYLLAPTPPDVQGQRLTDKSSQMNASYGQSRTRGWGTGQVPANILQKSEIRETTHVRTEGASKHEYTVTTYTYSADIALGFGQGPAVRFLDLYADSKLLWSGSVDSEGNARPFAQAADIGTITFYLGTETQEPDPILEELVGAGNQPAYRGEVYIVLGNLQLANFGNRIPVFKANICYSSGSDARPYVHILNSASAGIEKDVTGRPYVYGWGGSSIYKINTIANQVEATVADADAAPSRIVNFVRSGPNNRLYIGSEISYGGADISVVNANSMKYEKSLGTTGVFDHAISNSGPIGNILAFKVNGALTVAAVGAHEVVFYIRNSKFENSSVQIEPLTNVWQFQKDTTANGLITVWGDCVKAMVSGPAIADKNGVVWVANGTNLSRIDDDNITGSVSSFFGDTCRTCGVTDFDMTGIFSSPSAMVYVEASHSVMVLDTVRGGWIQISLSNQTEINFLSGSYTGGRGGWMDGFETDGAIVVGGTHAGGNTSTEFSKVSAGPVETGAYSVPDWTGATGSAYAYDSASNSVFLVKDPNLSGVNDIYRFYLDRGGPGAVSLQEVVESLHTIAGLGMGVIDATELASQMVQGMILVDNQSVRDVLRMLMQAYIFDAFEEDGRVVYKWRTGSSVLTIQEDDLAASENFPTDEEAFPRDFSNELDAPMRVEVQFFDATRNYDTNAQEAKRIQNPTPTMLVKSTLLLKLPIVMTPSEGRQLADKVLWYKWASRLIYEIKTSWKHARVSPCDIITVNYKGRDYLMRVLQVDLGATPIVVIKAESHDPEVYISTVSGDSGSGFEQTPIVAVVPTEFFALDTPLITDGLTNVTGFYGATCTYNSKDWRGAVIYRSLDGVKWDIIGSSNIASPWASLVAALGDWKQVGAFDDQNELSIKMIDGDDPTDRTKLDVLNENAGLIAIVKNDGSVELVNYVNSVAADTADVIGDAGPIPPAPPPDPQLEVNDDNLQKLTTWLQPGDVGNTGGGDPNADSPGTMYPGDIAKFVSHGKYPYNNAFWYIKRGAHNKAVKFYYRLELRLPTAGDLAACRCIEWQIQQNANDTIFNMAYQLNFITNEIRDFTFTGVTGTGHWDSTGFTFNPADWAGGQWVTIECVWTRTNNTVTHETIKINGTTYNVNNTRAAVSKVQADYVEPAFQLDADSNTPPTVYTCEARRLQVIMYDSTGAVITPTPSPVPVSVDRKFILTNLLRGRRGTEWNIADHEEGEKAIFLNVPLRFIETYTDRGKAAFLRSVSNGQAATQGIIVPFTLACNDSKPYAPCFIRGYRDVSGNWTIHWERRTRFDGDWHDGIETVPLNEESELYDIEICALDETIKKTYTDLPVKYAFYTAAMQASDFGGTQAQLLVNIYQKSAQVGRGFKGSAIIDINGNYGTQPTIDTSDDPFQVNGV